MDSSLLHYTAGACQSRPTWCPNHRPEGSRLDLAVITGASTSNAPDMCQGHGTRHAYACQQYLVWDIPFRALISRTQVTALYGADVNILAPWAEPCLDFPRHGPGEDGDMGGWERTGAYFSEVSKMPGPHHGIDSRSPWRILSALTFLPFCFHVEIILGGPPSLDTQVLFLHDPPSSHARYVCDAQLVHRPGLVFITPRGAAEQPPNLI